MRSLRCVHFAIASFTPVGMTRRGGAVSLTSLLSLVRLRDSGWLSTGLAIRTIFDYISHIWKGRGAVLKCKHFEGRAQPS